jgi:hypothetical protein
MLQSAVVTIFTLSRGPFAMRNKINIDRNGLENEYGKSITYRQ